MELDRAFFEKYDRVAKATKDPKLRLARELCLAQLWKKYGPQDNLQATFAEMRRATDYSIAVCKRVEDGLEKSHAALSFAPQIAGSGRADHVRADRATDLSSVDTRRATFQPQPVTVQPGETLQEAMLRSARENRQDAEISTSPAQPWTPADRRDRSRADAFADVRKIDELERLSMRRIGAAGALECTKCGQKIFATSNEPEPLRHARRHAEEHQTADSLVGVPARHMVSHFPGSDRNF